LEVALLAPATDVFTVSYYHSRDFGIHCVAFNRTVSVADKIAQFSFP